VINAFFIKLLYKVIAIIRSKKCVVGRAVRLTAGVGSLRHACHTRHAKQFPMAHIYIFHDSQEILFTMTCTNIRMQLEQWMIWNLKSARIYQQVADPSLGLSKNINIKRSLLKCKDINLLVKLNHKRETAKLLLITILQYYSLNDIRSKWRHFRHKLVLKKSILVIETTVFVAFCLQIIDNVLAAEFMHMFQLDVHQ